VQSPRFRSKTSELRDFYNGFQNITHIIFEHMLILKLLQSG